MPDDKSKVGQSDRDRVSAGENYELLDFAKANGITVDQAKMLSVSSMEAEPYFVSDAPV